MSQHCARTSRRIGLTALALLAALPSVAAAQATDGFISTLARIGDPADLAYDDRGLLVADRANNFIRRVAPDGTVSNAAGTGSTAGNCSDGNDDLTRPRGVTTGAPGGGFIVTTGNCIMRVTPNGDTVRVAGAQDGGSGLTGDGGPARGARLDTPADTTIGPDGSIYIADTVNDRVRRVAPDGTIATFAGSTRGFSGDGGPATSAQLDTPRDIAVFPDGTVLIADLGNDRIRRVTPDGIITTVAGGNGSGFSGDGDPAVTAQLHAPVGIVALANGGFLLADALNNRVRRVTPLGAIFTVAGGGSGGDGGLAKDAGLSSPEGITARPGGGFAIADTGAGRVREVTDVGAVPGAALGRSINVAPALGTVTVQPAGAPASLPLNEEDLVPLGSQVDATRGRLTVAVRRTAGSLEPGLIYAGAFVPTQRGDRTDLTLTADLGCTDGSRSFLAKKGKKKKRKRRLWVDAKGKYRIKGRYVGALERGTKWRVTDTCDRSTVRVERGRVKAVDLIRGTRRTVRAGETFTVRAR